MKTETAGTNSGCRSYKDYTINMNIDLPASGDANVQLNVDPGSTSIQGVDFDFTTNGNFTTPSTSVSFQNGSGGSKIIYIRIYDNAKVEGQQYFILNATMSGSTNAIVAPSSQSYRCIINDNDHAPLPSSFNVGPNNTLITRETPFKSTVSKFRMQCLFTYSELKAAGLIKDVIINSIGINVLTKNSTKPFNAFTINIANSNVTSMQNGFINTIFTQVFSGNYNTVSGNNILNFTTPFVWDGNSNILVQFCFDNTSSGVDIASDIVDGNDSPILGGYATMYSDPNNLAGSACFLNSSNASPQRMKISFGTAYGNDIEILPNKNSSIYLGDNGNYYCYDFVGNILTSIQNASSPVGCLTANIVESGNAWKMFYGGKRSQKVFELLSSNNVNTSYKLGLYYTVDELGGLNPGDLKIATTTAATADAANPVNSLSLPTIVKSYGNGYVFYATTNVFSKFFLVNNLVTLPVTLLFFKGNLIFNYAQFEWQTSAETNARDFEIERSIDGIHFNKIGTVKAKGNTSETTTYTFTDRTINEINYYRLKIVDIDNKYTFSQIVSIKKVENDQKIWVENNPFRTFVDVDLKNIPKGDIKAEIFQSQGNKIYSKQFPKDNHIHIDLSALILSSGLYILRVESDGKLYTSKLLKQ